MRPGPGRGKTGKGRFCFAGGGARRQRLPSAGLSSGLSRVSCGRLGWRGNGLWRLWYAECRLSRKGAPWVFFSQGEEGAKGVLDRMDRIFFLLARADLRRKWGMKPPWGLCLFALTMFVLWGRFCLRSSLLRKRPICSCTFPFPIYSCTFPPNNGDFWYSVSSLFWQSIGEGFQ